MKKLKVFLLAGCAALLAACAHSPVQVVVQPQVQVAPDNIGAGYTVTTRGVNQLAGGGLGSLGGIYADSSNVTLANNIEDSMAQALSQGFESWSFRSVGGPADVQVVANLTALSYDSPNTLYTTKVDSGASIQLQVSVKGAVFYGNYSTSGKDRNLIKPSREEVEATVNRLLSATLQRAFEDEKLKSFLRQHL
ncbi:YajG family lipoprotein [Microbulbifer bruguierae]|uniref:YajG family lipoprotein n=1 Tax=Microbulbifer bruguierae TaxID=3029061 RepID=A0ABY8N9A6_9GAMM|nr:YajG family lipoprotein [Microbulbifer bruguierae]WGL15004.1 YajG family lipoprotein [Microbulbifer bruguierae]